MKLYTGRGDTGQTDLFGGQRVSKHALRVEAYGAVDELNSLLGVAAAASQDEAMLQLLRELQCGLFELGADLATPKSDDRPEKNAIPRIGQARIEKLEAQIDAHNDALPPMKHFILPGGSELAARLHQARTVCRRAERRCVALDEREPIGPGIIIYLNRLGDLLFALARHANHKAGVADIPWRPRGENA